MDKAKTDRLAAAGWRSGEAADFLELTEEEAAFVELKLALADYLRELRTQQLLDAVAGGAPARLEPVAGRQDGGCRRLGLARSAGQVASRPRSVAQRGRPRDLEGGVAASPT